MLKATVGAGATAGLSGCTTSREGENSGTLQWIADADIAGASGEVLQGLYDAGLPKDIKLNITAGPASTDRRQQQLARWMDSGLRKPDLILADSGWTIPFIVRKQLLNLAKAEEIPNSLINHVENEYFGASVQTAKHPTSDDLYAIPLYANPSVLYYRKDLVEKAGYNPDGENWATESTTWKRFSHAIRDVLDQNPGMEYGYTFQASAYEGLSCCDFNEFLSSWGGAYFGGRENLFGPVGQRPVTIDNQSTINAIRMVRTFINGQSDPHSLPGYAGNISPAAVLSWIEDTSLAPFSNGNAVANRNWPFAIPVNREALGNRLGVMPIPYAVPEKESRYNRIGGPTAALGGWHIGINPNSENINQAAKVLQAMASPEFRITLLKTVGQLPPDTELLQSKPFRENLGRYAKTLQVAGEKAIPRPVTTIWPQESTKIALRINRTFAGSSAPAKTVQTLQGEIESIENYNS